VTIYIALLRGINVGGNKKVAMSDLRSLAAELGFEEPRTILQSGNLLFRGRAQRTESIERRLDGAIKTTLGTETECFVRTAEEWKAAVASNPFREEAKSDPGHLLLMALQDPPAAHAVDALRAAIVGRERVEVRGREAYLVYPDGVGRSKLTHSVIEKKLGTRGTARNWNTVTKLLELAR